MTTRQSPNSGRRRTNSSDCQMEAYCFHIIQPYLNEHHSDLDLLGTSVLLALQQVVDLGVHLLEGLAVDDVEQQLGPSASQFFEALAATFLDDGHDLCQFLLGELFESLVQSVLFREGDFLLFPDVSRLLVDRCWLLIVFLMNLLGGVRND